LRSDRILAWKLALARSPAAAWRTIRRPPRWLVLALVVAAIEVLYVFIITAGTFTHWPGWNANYNLQAEGFRAGHLYLLTPVSPELLAKANPYDWANVRLWFWDATLYKGRYYLYWGPLPALMLAGFKTVFRIDQEIGDQYPLFLFYTMYLVAGALVIERMARRLFPGVPFALVVLAVIVFGCANPTPYMIATPGIYEAAIIGGQAFLLLGLLFAFNAVWRADSRPPPRVQLVAAGCCWVFAIACRASVGVAVFALCLLALFAARAPGRAGWWQLVRNGCWLGGPVTLGILGLLAYNKARFDSWLEFGLRYQLNTLPLVSSRKFVPLNLFSYMLRPLAHACRFPFLSAYYNIGVRGFPSWVTLPPGYTTPEPLVGLLPSAPWVGLLLVAPVVACRALLRRLRDRERGERDHQGRIRTWCALSLLALGTLCVLPIIAHNGTTMRYLADMSTGLVLLAIWCAFTLYGAVQSRPWLRRTTIAGFVTLAAVTVVIGALLGFQGYDDMFGRHNPELAARLTRALSFCGRR
jgi:hypothetical protein